MMLSFDRPSAIALGLFADDAFPGRFHALQDRLALAADEGGAPELSLVLHSAGTAGAGGLFQARLRADRTETAALAALNWTPAEIVAARMRVTLRAPISGAEELGRWRTVALGGRDDLLVAFQTTPDSAELLRVLALQAANPVTLEVELEHAGRIGGLPYLARADATELHDQLAALLGPGAATAKAVEAAFLSLRSGLVRLERLGAGAEPGGEALLREVAQRALAHLFERRESDDGVRYILSNPPEVDAIAWRLDLPRVALRRTRLRWEMDALTRTLKTDEARARHFPVARAVRPFEAVEIRALNQIPLDPEHALRLRLDLAYTGRGGTEETTTIEFRPGEPLLKSVRTVYPALTHPFRVASRLRLMIASPTGQGFPTLWPETEAFETAENPLALDLSPARADVELLELRALDGVFAACSGISCSLRRGARETRARLTASKPCAWVALPGRAQAPLTVRLEAAPLTAEQGVPVVIREAPVAERRVLVTPLDVSVLEPDRVIARLSAGPVVFAVVEVRPAGSAESRARVLRPGGAAEFTVWRPHIFAPLAFDWRISAVRRDGRGRTMPIETTAWTPGAQRELDIAS